MPIQDWPEAEKVVRLLEQALGPAGARVRRDVKLPVLNSKRSRQCDVVIEAPLGPRTVRSIVEVQKRAVPVEIGEFQGWCVKRKEVGAHTLICVSRLPFPSSIREYVDQHEGPRVALLTLDRLERGTWPVMLPLGAVRCVINTPDIDASRPVDLGVAEGSTDRHYDFSTGDAVFHRDGIPTAVCLQQLVHEVIEANDETLRWPAGTRATQVQIETTPALHLSVGTRLLRVTRLRVEVRIVTETWDLPLSFSAYKASTADRPLAWIGTAEGRIAGHDVRVRMVLVQEADGIYRVAAQEVEGMPGRPRCVISTLPPQ